MKRVVQGLKKIDVLETEIAKLRELEEARNKELLLLGTRVRMLEIKDMIK